MFYCRIGVILFLLALGLPGFSHSASATISQMNGKDKSSLDETSNVIINTIQSHGNGYFGETSDIINAQMGISGCSCSYTYSNKLEYGELSYQIQFDLKKVTSISPSDNSISLYFDTSGNNVSVYVLGRVNNIMYEETKFYNSVTIWISPAVVAKTVDAFNHLVTACRDTGKSPR